MLGLVDRGMVKEGYVADLVVFDPLTIRDKSTFEDPHQYSEGIDYLFISGIPVIDGGEYTGKLAGKTLRLNQ